VYHTTSIAEFPGFPYISAMTTILAGPRTPTTEEFSPVSDHARLPWRFFARMTADGRRIG
jgi:hypothetical protein